MPGIDPVGFGFVVALGMSLAGVGVLIGRGTARPGNVVIILLMPLFYLFAIPIMAGEMPEWSLALSSKLVLGIICSIVAGLIVRGIRKK